MKYNAAVEVTGGRKPAAGSSLAEMACRVFLVGSASRCEPTYPKALFAMKDDGSTYDLELAEILSNPEFGVDEESRRQNLRAAKLSATILTWLTIPGLLFAMVFSALSLSQYRPAGMLVMLSLPWIGLLLLLKFPVLRMFHTSKTQRYAYPSLDVPFIIPAIGVFALSSTFGHPVSFEAVVYAAILPGLLIAGVFISLVPYIRRSPWLWLFFLVFGLFYGGGALVFGNAYFDRSPATPHWSKVVGKYVSHGKHTSYHLDLSPWLDGDETESVTVPANFYQAKNVGDPVEVLTRPGYFKIEWYTLR
jgi:hypothetical protein